LSTRPRLTAIAAPLFGEFVLGIIVMLVGLRLASTESVAEAGAFGLATQMLESVFVLFRVLAIGVGVVITQASGGAAAGSVQRTALAGLASSTWVGLLVGVALLFGDDVALRAMNAPDTVRPFAGPMLQAFALAALLDAYNLTMAAILRALLFARDSLRVMLAMHSTHLVLAIALMRGVGEWEGLGLIGYAVALIASRLLGLVLHLWLWRRRLQLVPTVRDWWIVPKGSLWPVLRIGVPSAALEASYRIGFMISLAAGAKLGVVALAAQAYTLQIQRVVLLVSLAIGWAAEIMVGRLVGAGDLRAAEQLVRKALRNGLIASGFGVVAAALAAPWILRVFTRDPQVIEAAQTLLFIAILLETGRVYNLVYIGVLRASGDAIYPVAASVASIFLVLGLGSYWFGRWFGLPGIWFIYAADEWIRGLLMWWRWRRHGWLPHARETRRRLRGA
jgi:Na+-driven multidrug efflux pump